MKRSRTEIYPDTKYFHYYNANPKNRVTGDCTFRAVATALKMKWEDVVMDMAKFSIETGYAINDKKGIERYLASKGWTKCKQPRKWDNTKYTGKEFCYEIMNPVGDIQIDGDFRRVIADIGGHHIVAIIEGKVNDIWDSTDGCVGNYWVKEN